MGQAKQRGTREDRIVQAQRREQSQPSTSRNQSTTYFDDYSQLAVYQAASERLFSGLTTPAEINEQVLEFARMLGDTTPIFLDCQPELWSRQSCCDGNVQKYIELHGGEALCGYRIWYNGPIYIEGERHVVWTDGHTIRDVSFVDSGETRIVFVPDDKGFDDAPPKVRHAFSGADQRFIELMTSFDQQIPRLSTQETWDTFPTYEQWLAGRRQSNLFISS